MPQASESASEIRLTKRTKADTRDKVVVAGSVTQKTRSLLKRLQEKHYGDNRSLALEEAITRLAHRLDGPSEVEWQAEFYAMAVRVVEAVVHLENDNLAEATASLRKAATRIEQVHRAYGLEDV